MDLKQLKISDKKLAILNQMRIYSVQDLLGHYPFRYDHNEESKVEDWTGKQKVCFMGIIVSQARVTRYGHKKSATKFQVNVDDHILTITLFNRPWTSAFVQGKSITIMGRYEGGEKVSCSSYSFTPIEQHLGWIPVYNTKQGITSKDLQKYITRALNVYVMEDMIPSEYRNRYRLSNKQVALINIHNPKSEAHLKQSLRYLKYEEFLKFQLQMQIRKQTMNQFVGKSKLFSMNQVEMLIKQLPFVLTVGQREAVDEILQDLCAPQTMYRLLQGDVGCGKTIVASIAMYASVLANQQCAMMAPTEILARQHYLNMQQLFAPLNIHVALLTSSNKASERKRILQQLQDHEIHIIIGTHSLFQSSVHYANLGFVITDEQHRFGVHQRRQLLEKGKSVDFLFMSATPIPRTLAASLFNDMDVSTIQQLPTGRKSIVTQFVNEDSMQSFIYDILQQIDEGVQMYVVCPAIQENEDYAMRNVKQLYAGMTKALPKKYRIALLHGKMSAQEKEDVMQSFKHHEFDILITTTVVEVGVDVINANIMVIYDAHRFGMSQLHQLRGRVGRGNQQGYCYLLSGTKDEQAIERLQLVASCSDGFEIAKADLSLRGSGDLLGVRQSGLPSFVVADVFKDLAILEVAREDAKHLLQAQMQYPSVVSYLQSVQMNEYFD